MSVSAVLLVNQACTTVDGAALTAGSLLDLLCVPFNMLQVLATMRYQHVLPCTCLVLQSSMLLTLPLP